MKILVCIELKTDGKKCDNCQFLSDNKLSCTLFHIDIKNEKKRCDKCNNAEEAFNLLKIEK